MMMINASRQQARDDRKRKADEDSSTAPPAGHPQHPEAQHAAAAPAAAPPPPATRRKLPRQRGDDNIESNTSSGVWSPQAWKFIQTMMAKLRDSIHFDARGTHKLQGKWPALAYSLIQPSADPLYWRQMMMADNEDDDTDDQQLAVAPMEEVLQEYASLPDFMLWAPELRWPQLYPAGRPPCPYHRTTDCVEHMGSASHVRRCRGKNGNDVALASRRYKCVTRKYHKENPFCFSSTCPAVMDQAPLYVQQYWRDNGFHLKRRSGASFGLTTTKSTAKKKRITQGDVVSDDGFVREAAGKNERNDDGGGSNSGLVYQETNELPFAAVDAQNSRSESDSHMNRRIATTLTANTAAASYDYMLGHAEDEEGGHRTQRRGASIIHKGQGWSDFFQHAGNDDSGGVDDDNYLVDNETILPFNTAVDNMARDSDNTNHDSPNKFTINASIAAAPSTLAPREATIANTAMLAAATPFEMPQHEQKRPARQRPRCTKCGHDYSATSPYGIYHQGQGKRGRVNSLQPKDVCTVPASQRKLNPDGTLPGAKKVYNKSSGASAMSKGKGFPDANFCQVVNVGLYRNSAVNCRTNLPSATFADNNMSRSSEKDIDGHNTIAANNASTAATKSTLVARWDASTIANTAALAAPAIVQQQQQPQPQKRPSRKGARCSKCGHEYSRQSPYSVYHQGQGKRGRMNSLQPKDVCTVPPSQRKLNPDGTLPRRADWNKRKRKNRANENTNLV